MKISPARTAAFDILLRIERDKAFSSVLLPKFEEKLSASDRSLCHELVLGTLRRLLYLDRIIDTLTSGKKLDIEVRIAIRLGLYQMLFLSKVPPYSALNESVNLVVRAKKSSAKGFVNAVLRRASRESVELSFTDELDKISGETSHPQWLIKKWAKDIGIVETAKLAAANNEMPAAAFRVLNHAANGIEELLAASARSKYVDGCYVAQKHESLLRDLSARGDIYIQDESSQMIAQAVRLSDRGVFLDACAAPGGKTGLIARRAEQNTKLIVAGDLYYERAKFLLENCQRQDVGFVNVLQYDAERPLPFAPESFDTVLVDAPCSGTGTIRSNPELRYSIQPDDIATLSSKQLSILQNASNVVRRNGTLIYSTCSLEREENEWVCTSFLDANAGFRLEVPKIDRRFITQAGFVRTWPNRDNTDGFFAAVFRHSS